MHTSPLQKILLVCLTLAGVVWFVHPARAAVPVAVVQFDSSTNFEQSIEQFLGNLLDAIETKREESTAAYELLKIEKAREDVNKLVQETQAELTDYGLSLVNSSDPRLSDNPQCIADPANCQDAKNNITITPFKDSRIIHNVYDYLFEEPREKARVFTMCYFNTLLWDQTTYSPEPSKTQLEHLFEIYNIPAQFHNPPPGLCAIDPNDNGKTSRCSYGASTLESVNNLRSKRDALLFLLKGTNQYQLNYPQIFLFGDWAGYPDVADPKYQRYGIAGRGESDSETLREESFRNCVPVLTSVSGNTAAITDPGLAFHNVNPDEITNILPTLDKSVVDRNDASWEELRIAKQDRNKLEGVLRTAFSMVDQIISEIGKERELTYLAGQGIRPERLYKTVEGNTKSEISAELAGGPPLPEPTIRYQYDTGYIISPAVVLLQKMQAADQAMFDLAGNAFLYLTPETPVDQLNRYGVSPNGAEGECFDTAGNSVNCPFFSASQKYKRQACNFPGTADEQSFCVWLKPWLRPTRYFKSAPLADPIGPRFLPGSTSYSSESGLPAPWEDPARYITLGNEKVANDELKYTVAKYTPRFDDPVQNPALNFTRGDNLLSPVLGADYAINDWYDRVFEMYEADRRPIGQKDSTFTFSLTDWQCYLATWFLPEGVFSPGGFTYTRTAPQLTLGLPDRFTIKTATVNTQPGSTGPQDDLVKNYCRERLANGSY